MGKISDIWVRLGLKKDDFDKGMDDAAKKTEGVGGAFGKMKATALAVWAVSPVDEWLRADRPLDYRVLAIET